VKKRLLVGCYFAVVGFVVAFVTSWFFFGRNTSIAGGLLRAALPAVPPGFLLGMLLGPLCWRGGGFTLLAGFLITFFAFPMTGFFTGLLGGFLGQSPLPLSEVLGRAVKLVPLYAMAAVTTIFWVVFPQVLAASFLLVFWIKRREQARR